MATLGKRKDSRYVQFLTRSGNRKTVALGKIPLRPAEEIRGHIAALERAMLTGTAPPRRSADWLTELSDMMHAKLSKAGLTEPRRAAQSATSLSTFLDGYIAGRTDITERARTNLAQARNAMVAHFGESADLSSLTRGKMKDWRRRMLEDLSEATVSGHIKKARQMLREAVDHGLLADNPLNGVAAGSQANESRRVYIPASDVLRVIDACPDVEWRLIFALARFGGLRTPSETFALRWSDVDFAGSRIVVRSPKTQRHAGKGSRTIPLFAELLPYLLDAHEQAKEGADFIITTRAAHNLRTHATRIIERAGLTVWAKPFQNMRVSCEADLLTRFAVTHVIAWIGHSARVQREHYNKVPDAAFAEAAGAAPSAAERSGKGQNEKDAESTFPPANPENVDSHESCRGYSFLADSAENLRIPETALRRALQRLKLVMPSIRRSDIERLSSAIAAARAGGIGGGL